MAQGLNQQRLGQVAREVNMVAPDAVAPPVSKQKPYDMAGAINSLIDGGMGLAAKALIVNHRREEIAYDAEAAKIASTLTYTDMNVQEGEAPGEAFQRWLDVKTEGYNPRVRQKVQQASLGKLNAYRARWQETGLRDTLSEFSNSVPYQLTGDDQSFTDAQRGIEQNWSIARQLGVSKSDYYGSIYGSAMQIAAQNGDVAAANRLRPFYAQYNAVGAEALTKNAKSALSNTVLVNYRAQLQDALKSGMPSAINSIREKIGADARLDENDRVSAVKSSDTAEAYASGKVSVDAQQRIIADMNAAEQRGSIDDVMRIQQTIAASPQLEETARNTLTARAADLADNKRTEVYRQKQALVPALLNDGANPVKVLDGALKSVADIPGLSDEKRAIWTDQMRTQVQESVYKREVGQIPAFSSPDAMAGALKDTTARWKGYVDSGVLTRDRARDLMGEYGRAGATRASENHIGELREMARPFLLAGTPRFVHDRTQYIDANGKVQVISRRDVIEPMLPAALEEVGMEALVAARRRGASEADQRTAAFGAQVNLVKALDFPYQPWKSALDIAPGRLTPGDLTAAIEGNDGTVPDDIAQAIQFYRQLVVAAGPEMVARHISSENTVAFYNDVVDNLKDNDDINVAVKRSVSRMIGAKATPPAALSRSLVAQYAEDVDDDATNQRDIQAQITVDANRLQRDFGYLPDDAAKKAADKLKAAGDRRIDGVWYPLDIGPIDEDFRWALGTVKAAWGKVHGIDPDRLRVRPVLGNPNVFQLTQRDEDNNERYVSDPTGTFSKGVLDDAVRARASIAERRKAEARAQGESDRNRVKGIADEAQADMEDADTVGTFVGSYLTGGARTLAAATGALKDRALDSLEGRLAATQTSPSFRQAEDDLRQARALVEKYKNPLRHPYNANKARLLRALAYKNLFMAATKGVWFADRDENEAMDAMVDYENRRAGRGARMVAP